VFGLCVRLLNHRHDAEDVTQEVFLRVFRSLRGWDSGRPLKPWIMGIAVNRCRTWLAQRIRRPELVDYLQDTLPGPATDDSGELLQEIQTALGELRLEYRTAFVLFHEQGQPYEDIAHAMDRPVGTIKTWLHRARMEILERLRRRGMISDDSEEHPAAPLTERGREQR
jgi:RNA polymerase sigma-70 factor (ECF subfamily)